MFSAAEMQLIRNHHEADYKALLNDLSLPPPVWKDGDDELRFYDDIDDKLTKELCALMKSSTLYDGYTELLKLGGVGYDYSETFNQMLGMVVANREKILSALQKQIDDYYKPEPEPVENFIIEVTDLKPFDKQKLTSTLEMVIESLKSLPKFFSKKTDRSPNDYHIAIQNTEITVNTTKKMNNLFELSEDKRSFHSVDDFLNAYSNSGTCTVQLKITKTVEPREEKNSTTAPKFDVKEMEHVLDILERVDDLVKKI